MLKRKGLLLVSALTSLLNSVAAQEGEQAAELFGSVYGLIGPRGIDFIFAFAVVYVSVLALTRLSQVFGADESMERLGMLFAAVFAAAAGIWVVLNHVPFYSIMAPYGLVTAILFIGYVGYEVVRNVGHGENIMAAIGLGLFVIGWAITNVFSGIGNISAGLGSLVGWGPIILLTGVALAIAGFWREYGPGGGAGGGRGRGRGRGAGGAAAAGEEQLRRGMRGEMRAMEGNLQAAEGAGVGAEEALVAIDQLIDQILAMEEE